MEQNNPPDVRGAPKKKPYHPPRNSAPYAILITLLRTCQNGKMFMTKMELIDAAEASGLSRVPIMRNKVFATTNRRGHDWYNGWNSMAALIKRGLVIKSSNPAKYQLTHEGVSTAQTCLAMFSLEETSNCPVALQGQEYQAVDADEGLKENGVLQGNLRSRQSISQVLNENIPKELPAPKQKSPLTKRFFDSGILHDDSIGPGAEATESSVLDNELAVPPLRVGEKFSDVYNVICILDNREQFRRGATGSLLGKFVDGLELRFKLSVEKRCLPVGDVLWVARDKNSNEEYVLDFIVERKAVDDLWESIKDNRYKRQKLRLMSCGLKRLVYVVEGDPNLVEATESLKTAMFTTELAGGFNVQRTAHHCETLRLYGYLSLAIIKRYDTEIGQAGGRSGGVCKNFAEFTDFCRGLVRDRITDVFCVQIMQVNYVTEDMALSILDRYPTLFSIMDAYAKLGSNVDAQEKMLQGSSIHNSNKFISAVVSKNIYKLIWAP